MNIIFSQVRNNWNLKRNRTHKKGLGFLKRPCKNCRSLENKYLKEKPPDKGQEQNIHIHANFVGKGNNHKQTTTNLKEVNYIFTVL